MLETDDARKLQEAFSFHRAGNLDQAAKIYRQIIKRDANNAGALHYLGVIEASVGNSEQAKSLMARSLKIQPLNAQFIENYATLLFKTGDFESAVRICQQGLQINEANVSLLYVSAISLYKLEQLQNSISHFDRLLLLQPNHIAAINERGSALAGLGEYDAAFASFEKALRLQPQYAEAHLNLGNVYSKVRRYDEALAAYDKALKINPALFDAWLGRGIVFRELKRYDEAFAAYDKALAIKHESASVWLGLGNVSAELKRFDDAITAYDKALALEPTLDYAEGARLHAKMHLCDWSNFDAERAHLISSISAGTATSPFGMLAILSSPRDQLQCVNRYTKRNYPPTDKSVWRGDGYKNGKIRIAYVSADFRQHAVSVLIAGLIESHSKERFEVTGISLQSEDRSETGQRMRHAFERFIDASKISDENVADLMRELEVDIAIDLMGFTQSARTNIFAQRPAPIQVNYLGYPGTMGAPYIDYIIADEIVIPNHRQDFYSEKIVYMPHSFQANDRARSIADRIFTRHELGLPPDGFVFCCFNNSYKLTPDVFDIWMRVLSQVANSVLWLVADNKTVETNLRKAAARSIDAERLVFASRLPYPEHLARHSLADLFLDTAPFNAGTTASDALWAGLPILTRVGDTFAGRMTASLLNTIGLSTLITSTPQAYEELAIELATNPEKLAAIKHRLASNRLTTPLFDAQLFARHIEAAYTKMYERYQAKLPPGHIYVPQ